jgi:hypothetical protein
MTDATSDAGAELAERRRHENAHAGQGPEHSRHDRLISIIEAIMLSLVALLAAWSGYCAASWGTRSSDLLAHSSEVQVAAQGATQEGLQIRTFDSVAFNAVLAAYVTNNPKAYKLAVRRLRPGYRTAFSAWLALRPLKNTSVPADPSLLKAYHIPQEAEGRALTAEAHASFAAASSAGNTSDKYVRLTVILATILFLLGISGHFTVRPARYGLIGIGSTLILYSAVQVVILPGPPG